MKSSIQRFNGHLRRAGLVCVCAFVVITQGTIPNLLYKKQAPNNFDEIFRGKAYLLKNVWMKNVNFNITNNPLSNSL